MATKKFFIMYILEILKKHSDEDHPLTHNMIIDYMEKEYDMKCERKAVSRNINDLKELGYNIEGGRNEGQYLVNDFTDGELRFLIDSVTYAKHIKNSYSEDLVKKLKGLASEHFAKSIKDAKHFEDMDSESQNREFFLTVEELSKAIEKERKVKLYYNKYDIDGKLVHTSDEKRIVNPYKIVIANGRYYLISNIDSHDNSTHLRIDKISGVEILENEPVKQKEKVEEFRNGLNLPRHMAEHVYMFSGKPRLITMKIADEGMDYAYDWLGNMLDSADLGNGYHRVTINANPDAIKYWAVQFGTYVEILEPAELRKETAEMVRNIYDKYAQED